MNFNSYTKATLYMSASNHKQSMFHYWNERKSSHNQSSSTRDTWVHQTTSNQVIL